MIQIEKVVIAVVLKTVLNLELRYRYRDITVLCIWVRYSTAAYTYSNDSIIDLII